jgi:uncharacterized phage-like protein YoqJ
MKSILFIEKKLRIDKIGILYLSSIIKKAGHRVDLIQDDIDNAEEYLSKNPVDFIMYSVMTGEHLWFLERNKQLKEKFQFIQSWVGLISPFFRNRV